MLTNAEKFWPVLTVSTSCEFQLFGVSCDCAPLDLPIVRRLHASIETCPQQRPFDLPSFRCKPERGRQEKNAVWELIKVPKIQRNCAIWSRIKMNFHGQGCSTFQGNFEVESKTESSMQEPPCSLSRKGEIWWNTFEIHWKYSMLSALFFLQRKQTKPPRNAHRLRRSKQNTDCKIWTCCKAQVDTGGYDKGERVRK